MSHEILKLENITKRFPGVLANDRISMNVAAGTILGLVGENGAGKTTLMRIVYGMYQPDDGQIFFKDRLVDFRSPRDSMAAGIAMVHQQSLLIPSMTVVENLMLAHPQGRLPNFADMKGELREVMERYGLHLDLDQTAGTLTVAERQRAEILKALHGNADLIILDEPTTVLTPQEANTLFESMRRLSDEAKTIIFITHKLPEVTRATDLVTVLRAGRVVATRPTEETNEAELASLMVGREVRLRRQREMSPLEESVQRPMVLSIDSLEAEDNQRNVAVKSISFDVFRGEIVGIAAVQGNGQSELVEAIMGLRDVKGGEIRFEGRNITKIDTRKRRDLGIHYIPRDRQLRGVNGLATVWENLILGHHHEPPISRRGLLEMTAVRRYSRDRIAEFQIVTPSTDTVAKNLSGGNLQKVVIARELAGDATLIIAEEPTQGVDVAATEFIRDTLIRLRDAGVAVLLVSSALEEVLDLSDRVLVMYSGELMGVLSIEEANEQLVGRMMLGVERRQPAQTSANDDVQEGTMP